MIETYAETTENMIKEEMQKKLSDMITKNEKLKEKNEYLKKEVEDAKAVGERALCEVQELIEKNKRLVEEHNRQNGTIQALNIALDVITDRYVSCNSTRRRMLFGLHYELHTKRKLSAKLDTNTRRYACGRLGNVSGRGNGSR